MEFIDTGIEGLFVLEPKVFGDNRGYFMESFRNDHFEKRGIDVQFIQDNESSSNYGVLRGLHYQCGAHAQSKLVKVVQGKVFDVAVDIRSNSPTYRKSFGIELSAENKKQLFIPAGFAHGFVVLSESAIFQYKVDNLYSKESEGGIIFNDPELAVDWKIDEQDILLSDKDKKLPKFGLHRNIDA